VYGLPVTESAFPFFGRIEFFSPRAVDNAQDRLSLQDQRNADAAVLVAAGVIASPVDGVYDPYGLVS